jgi:hypothetical protein
MDEPECRDDLPEVLLQMLRERLKSALGRATADRASYIAAIIPIAQFVNATLGTDMGVRLMKLALALADLDRGVVVPLLKPAPLQAGSSMPSEEWALRAHAALALECLILSGVKPAIAAKELAAGAKIDTETLINWRRELRAQSRKKNTLARTIFENGLTSIRELNKSELRTMAHDFIKQADGVRARLPVHAVRK